MNALERTLLKKLKRKHWFKGRHSCNLFCVFVSLSGNSRKNLCCIKYPAIMSMITRQQLIQQINVANIYDSVI